MQNNITAKQPKIWGPEVNMVKFFIRLNILYLAVKSYRNPLTAYKTIRKLDTFKKNSTGKQAIKKMARVGKRYYWQLYVPGWPSKAFNKFFTGELNRISPVNKKANRFSNIFFAITKKCTLQCEHCYEKETLNMKEKLSLDDLKNITQSIQEAGTSLVQLAGGEPLLRKNDMVHILQTTTKDINFWILTSGYQLTAETAAELKKAGLTGVSISLDNHIPALHNIFRGNEKAFEWVEKAVKNSIEAGLVVNLSLCATKGYVSEENLKEYRSLAQKWGVSFILLLEPREVGNYCGKNVDLSQEQYKILEQFFLDTNNDAQNRNYPIVAYHGYYQRRLGCSAAGERSLYIDADGNMHACPFCKGNKGNILKDGIEKPLEQLLTSSGCHKFETLQKKQKVEDIA